MPRIFVSVSNPSAGYLYSQELLQYKNVPYTSETKIAERALSRSRIEQKIRWFDVPMDDFPRVDVG